LVYKEDTSEALNQPNEESRECESSSSLRKFKVMFKKKLRGLLRKVEWDKKAD